MPNPDRWTEERDRWEHERQDARVDRWRDDRRPSEAALDQARSFHPGQRDPGPQAGYGDYNPGYGAETDRDSRSGPRVFGERETGASYNAGPGSGQGQRFTPPGDAYPVRWGGQGTHAGPYDNASPAGLYQNSPSGRPSRYDGREDAPPAFHGESFRGAGGFESQRGKGPRGYKRSDERILEQIHERLTEDHHLDASDIEVRVEGGETTLSGAVNDLYAKHRAEQLIEHLTGVSHVQNNLRVAGQNLSGGLNERGPASTDRLV